ncbi:MAG: hypothetical protein L6R40_000326 [Gallowayella cf. fulva]|nr:MAG: hypothetical protein L6R40_000326 [Xanthomendoza cf. fulva]
MAGPAGKKRQVSQTDIEPEESSMRTRSKATKENNGNRRTNRSSDQSNASSSTIVQHDKKRSSSQAPVKKKEPIVKNGIARVVKRTTNAKISKPSTVKETKRPRSSFSKVAISDGRSREDGNDVETIDEADAGTTDEDTEADNPHGPCYWLMKAEPNSRLEKGKDVKFSIDDLMKADKPEAWDGETSNRAKPLNVSRLNQVVQVYAMV